MFGTCLENKSKIVYKCVTIYTKSKMESERRMRIHLRKWVVAKRKSRRKIISFTQQNSREIHERFSVECMNVYIHSEAGTLFLHTTPSFHSMKFLFPFIREEQEEEKDYKKKLLRARFTIFDINHVYKTTCNTKCTHQCDEYRVWL